MRGKLHHARFGHELRPLTSMRPALYARETPKAWVKGVSLTRTSMRPALYARETVEYTLTPLGYHLLQ